MRCKFVNAVGYAAAYLIPWRKKQHHHQVQVRKRGQLRRCLQSMEQKPALSALATRT
jgi:hypothetical protein